MINDLIKASYDEVLYRSNSYNMTCIDRLYEVAKMHGLSPRNPDNARVLEIGCASGGNIMGQAINHPNSHFIGIDLSDEQVKIRQRGYLLNRHKKYRAYHYGYL